MNWIKKHPMQAVAFTAYFTIIATFAGFLPHLWVPFLVLFIIGLFFFALLFQLYKPLLTFLLAFLMFMMPGNPQTASASQKKGGEILVGVIVICGASYCIYRLARFCQQHFPPPNTNDVNQAESPFGTNNILGASFVLAADSCIDGGSVGTNATTFTINAMVQNGELRTAVSTSADSSSMEEFMGAMQAEGLQPGTTSYAVNGEPATSSSVPISYQPTTGTITNGIAGTAFLITVQASQDLVTWQQLFTTTAGEGTAFQVQDTVVAPFMFYRLILQ